MTAAQVTLQQQQSRRPGILIVGAGLGGLFLGIILEELGHPYHIFERATEVRPLGSTMALGPGILPVFEQLDLLKELEKFALPCHSVEIHNANMDLFGSIKFMERERSGYPNLLFERPDLYDLLLRRVPKDRISMGKKVLRTEEVSGRVYIHCADNTTYEGDILVGADGAYSGVRQSIYRELMKKGMLPKSDHEDFSVANISMVGVAEKQDPKKYPQLNDKQANFSTTLGHMKTRTVINIPDNRICWTINIQLSKEEAKAQHFRNSEWGPESNEKMIKEFEQLPCPWGGTMGEIIHATPKHLISKVFLEEKFFKTWYHGQTVLIGDGAVNAMQDAVVLANCISKMSDVSPQNITAAFGQYYKQRYRHALYSFTMSRFWTKMTYGQTWSERLLRQQVVNFTPEWVYFMLYFKTASYRPQIAWLPLAENRGTVRILPQDDIGSETKADMSKSRFKIKSKSKNKSRNKEQDQGYICEQVEKEKTKQTMESKKVDDHLLIV
ncbi:hypothetical protein BX616_002368 [Lobosporangium transversale]|nr:hypothetical protein BX616_002368 [Lobosporangium transversale]